MLLEKGYIGQKTQKLLRTIGRDYRKDEVPNKLIDALKRVLLENKDGTVPVFSFEIGKNPSGR